MAMVGGFDVHRQQITFDYVDNDGLDGAVGPDPSGDAEDVAELAGRALSGWGRTVRAGGLHRVVDLSEELAAAGVGVHLGDPAEIAVLRGPKKRAKTDRTDAKLLRHAVVESRRFPEWSAIPPVHVLEIRALGRFDCALTASAELAATSSAQFPTRAARRFGRCYRWRVARRWPLLT